MGTLVLGAAATATRLAGDERIKLRYPAIWTALGMIGSRQVQNRASLGGNICNAAPSAVAGAATHLLRYPVRDRLGSREPASLHWKKSSPGRAEPHLAEGEILAALRLPAAPGALGRPLHPVYTAPRDGHRCRRRRLVDCARRRRRNCRCQSCAGIGRANTNSRARRRGCLLRGQQPTPETFAQAAAASCRERCLRRSPTRRGSAEFRRKTGPHADATHALLTCGYRRHHPIVEVRYL